MATHLLKPDALVLDDAVVVEPIVAVDDGRITSIEPSEPGSARGQRIVGTLLPGFVDLQVNGAGGHSVTEGSPAALDAIATTVAQQGAAAFLPTVITAPLDDLLDQIRAAAAWIAARPPLEDDDPDRARPLGIHVEGPFLSNPGAHPPEAMRPATDGEIDALLEAGRGHVRLVTLAPDLPGAEAATRRLRAAGVTVALGHGSGTKGVAACAAAGATMATHLFNAMGPGDHRSPGLADTVLDTPELSCSLILDRIHVHEVRARLAFRQLGRSRTVLVTDAVSAMGMPPGTYRLGDQSVELRDGAVRTSDGTLAGSALSMHDAARNFLEIVPDAGPWTLAQVAATNPGRLIANPDFGRIAPGFAARFSVLHPDGSLRNYRPGMESGT